MAEQVAGSDCASREGREDLGGAEAMNVDARAPHCNGLERGGLAESEVQVAQTESVQHLQMQSVPMKASPAPRLRQTVRHHPNSVCFLGNRKMMLSNPALRNPCTLSWH